MKINLGLLLLVMMVAAVGGQGFAADKAQEQDLSPEVREAIDLLGKAPFALVMTSASYYHSKSKWPRSYRDISRAIEDNRHVFPEGFSYKSVTFTSQGGKECVVDFAFEWPTFEGGLVEGTVTLRAGGSIQATAKGAKTKWKKKPTIITDPLPKPAEPTDPKLPGSG